MIIPCVLCIYIYIFVFNAIRRVKWMNQRASTNEAYQPTHIEHIANVVTHGMWVMPSLLAGITLIQRSSTTMQLVSALVYGTALLLLFTVSTFFHSVHYCNHNRYYIIKFIVIIINNETNEIESISFIFLDS